MKKYIVLSVNANPDYLYHVPLCCWAWRKFGWEPILLMENGGNYENEIFNLFDETYELDITPPVDDFHWVHKIPGYRSDTITQVSRLYAACTLNKDSYLMTGDIDLIPLSDYWKFNEHEITVWGHDLTSFTHYPICFIGMPVHLWGSVMNLEPQWTQDTKPEQDFNHFIKRDLESLPNAKESAQWEKRWFVDQDLITKRLDGFHINFINRGQYSNGYAVGRVDRGAWSLNHSTFVDCHMFQQLYFKQNQDKFDKTMELLTSIWPDEDFGWWYKYTEEFRKLTGHS